MKRTLIFILSLTALGLITACKTEKLTPEEFVAWVDNPENNLSEEKVIDDFEFNLQYKPAQYLALKELSENNLTKADLDKKIKAYEKIHYFIFKVSTKDDEKDVLKYISQDPSEYQQKLQYFLADIKNDFFLFDGKDTLPCSFHNYERTFNLEPYSTFIVAFDRVSKEKNDLIFIYNDRLLQCGQVRLKIDKSTLTSTPEVKTTI